MKIPYYPGCTLKTQARNLETSALGVAEKLGIQLIELPRWNCCGTVFSLTDDDLIHHVAPIRNLVRVQEMNKNGLVEDEYRLVTLCSMCYNALKRSNIRVKENPDDLEKINNFMDLEDDYKGGVKVIHFLELVRDLGFDKVKEKVSNPLKGLKIAPYYGCMLLRPKEVGIDDPEEPEIQGKLLSSLGAEVIDNPYKKVCCGSYQTIQDKNIVSNLGYDILTHAQNEGADAISLSCPLCAFNFDFRQKDIKEKHPDFKEIPVFYFTQLMAIAFGFEEKVFGFDLNYIDPRPLLLNREILGVKK